MTIIMLAVACLALIPVTPSSVTKGWRGIVPLHSTCENAKRLLGITKCETGMYDFKDEKAFIWFSTKPCVDGWNVPLGTVTNIEVYPKQKLQLADLGIDLARFRKEPGRNVYEPDRYINEEEGVVIAAYANGDVNSFAYIPTTEDSNLRFPNSLAHQPTRSGDPHAIRKFDEYSDLAIKTERKRLNNFALQLRDEPNTQGFIIAYAGRRARAGEASARADQAKNYLVKTHDIGSARIVTIDGGYREKLTIELFVGSKGGTAPAPSPTVCPSEVQIIRVGAGRNNRVLSKGYD